MSLSGPPTVFNKITIFAMASACKNFYFSPKLYSLLLLTCLAQVVPSNTIGHDTLKTITANETYKFGYRLTKSQKAKTCLYSASSGLGLIRLAQLELKIYHAALEASSKLQKSTESRFKKMIREYLEDYNDTSRLLIKEKECTNNKIQASTSKVAQDLIGAYRMVRRFRNYIQQGLWDAFPSLTILKPLSGQGPFKRDMQLTMFAIIFAQLQYRWSPHNISMGRVKGMELGTTLQAVHSIELGVHAVSSGIYSVGIDWLELAGIKIQNGDQSADLNLAVDLLEKAKAKHDKLWQPFTSWSLNGTFFTKRLNDTSKNYSREWQRSIVFYASEYISGQYHGHGEDESWEICTGRLAQTEKTKSELFCWQETAVDPSWKIGPLKVELLARFPYQVVQFHDVLPSAPVQQINAECDTVLTTSELSGRQKHFDPKLRHCESCLGSFPQLERLTERITGLLSPSTEKIRPVTYFPPGGHIRSHIDKTELMGFEERIATLVYFLEGPEIGGELVFPKAKIAGKPLKGSAILWYNLYKSSEFDFETLHSSCALVKGRKTIATDWITYGHQTHLTCDKDSEAKMKYLFNGKSNF